MKGRVAKRNTPGGTGQTYEGVFQLTNEELGKVTAEDWQRAIDLAISVEDSYAAYDKIDLETDPSNDVHDDHVPIVPEIDPGPLQPEPEPNVIVVTPLEMLKCSGCTFETIDPVKLRQHMAAIKQCEFCEKSFHGRRSSQQFKSHQKTHAPKPEHPCDVCGKTFKFKSKVAEHKLRGPCGRM